MADLRLATSRKWRDKKTEELKEETEWHRIVVWGKQAEHCKEYLSKGRQVFVEGRIQTRKWEDKDGNDRYTTEIVAHNVSFLGGKGEGGGGGNSGNTGRRDAPPPGDDDIPF